MHSLLSLFIIMCHMCSLPCTTAVQKFQKLLFIYLFCSFLLFLKKEYSFFLLLLSTNDNNGSHQQNYWKQQCISHIQLCCVLDGFNFLMGSFFLFNCFCFLKDENNKRTLQFLNELNKKNHDWFVIVCKAAKL